MPLVSILIASFDNGRFLTETLESAIAQTHRDLEIVVIDDGSSDHSVEVIESFMATHLEANILFRRNEKPGGCGRIKRQLIELSHGEFFIFLDPDDTLAPDAVSVLLAEHQKGDYGIVYGTHYLCDEQLQPQSVSTYPGAIPEGQSHLTSTTGHISAPAMCRRSCYERTEGINPKFYVAEDQDLYLKMEEVAPVLFVDQPLYYYRHHGFNNSWNETKVFSNYYWRYHCIKEAYRRRKRNKASTPNLTRGEMNQMSFYYLVRLVKQKKHDFMSLFHDFGINRFIIRNLRRVGLASTRKLQRKVKIGSVCDIVAMKGTAVSLGQTASIELGDGRLIINDSWCKDNPFSTLFSMGESSRLVVKNTFTIYSNAHVSVNEGAVLELGGGFINHGARIHCFDHIKIGECVYIGDDVAIRDSDGHEMEGSDKPMTMPVIIAFAQSMA